MKNFDDPIELIIAAALDVAGIKFVHESENKAQEFDFYLPVQDIIIECKQFPTDRTEKQILKAENLILIQGRRAAIAFGRMISK